MENKKVFLDTEFTGLTKDTDLISIGLYIDEENYFYGEFNDWDRRKSFDWLEETVISKLEFNHTPSIEQKNDHKWKVKGSILAMETELRRWLAQYSFIEIWADVLAYDWVLFCQIFGGAFHIPENIFYTPFDLATFFRFKNRIIPSGKYEGDISRYDFVGYDKTKQHHALEDARVESLCYQKLMNHE